MRLQALTTDLLQKAIEIYQDLAYGSSQGGSARKRRIVPPAQGGLESLLGMFHKEQVESIPGHPCCRYSLRLGNRNYPFMKLLLQEHLLPGEYFFAVDTHDQMEIKPDYPDYEQWMAVRRFNLELKKRIEQQFEVAGLDTCTCVRRLLAERCADDVKVCRGVVLIVDDEEDLAAAVELLLQRRGYRTFKVGDGKSALQAVADLMPDLVLLDYELPELDGLQVIEKLRADPTTADVPVLLSSAARVSLAEIARADGFLAKPFPETLLYEMIDRVLQNREVRK